MLPFAGIVWEDEFPAFRETITVPEKDREQMFRLFALRVDLWRGKPLSQEDRTFWEELRTQVPEWALFQRLKVSADELAAQGQVEQEVAEELKEMFDRADRVEITEENGLQKFSATFNLKKEEVEKKSGLLGRIRHWWRK